MSAPQVQYLTKCRLCGLSIVYAPFVPIVGKPDPEVFKLVNKLASHLEKKHPKEHNATSQGILQFSGYAAASFFEMQDPLLRQMQEAVRVALHKATRKTYITDEEIQDRIVALGFTDDDADGLTILLRDMRDLLCEEGVYGSASSSAQSPIVAR